MVDEIKNAFDIAFRDYVTEGVPSSGRQKVNKSEVRAIGPLIAQGIAGATAGNVGPLDTWAALAAIPPTRNGQPGYVTTADAGTHTDPVVGGTVSNSGNFVGSLSPLGWRRVGDFLDATGLEEMILQSDRSVVVDATTQSLQAYTLPTQAEDAAFVDDWLRVLLADPGGNVIAGIDADHSLRGQFRDFPGVPALTDEFSLVVATEDGYVIAAFDRAFSPVEILDTLDLYGFTDNTATPRAVAIREGNVVPLSFGENPAFFAKAQRGVAYYVENVDGVYVAGNENLLLSTALSETVTRLVMVPIYGQSLSIGVATGSPVTTTAVRPGRAQSFNVGARLNGTTNPNTPLDKANILSLKDLLETIVETPASGIGYQITESGWLASTDAALVTTAGRSGTAYSGLKKGTQPYENLLEGVRRAAVFAAGLGLEFEVPAVVWIQGESNQADALATYEAYLLELQADLSNDIARYSGTPDEVLICEDQPSNWTNYLTEPTTSDIGLAMLKVALEHPSKFVCVGPKYHLTYAADGLHLTAVSSARMGDYHGRAIRQQKAGTPWLPLYISNAVRTGASIVLTFAGGSGDIELDTSVVSNPGNYGVEWFQTGGTARTISSVTKTGARQLTVTLSGDPDSPSGQQIGIARTGISGQNAGPTTGPRSCIRDSATEADRAGVIMRNYACHQLINVS